MNYKCPGCNHEYTRNPKALPDDMRSATVVCSNCRYQFDLSWTHDKLFRKALKVETRKQ